MVALPKAVMSVIASGSQCGPIGIAGSAAERRPVRIARSSAIVSPSETSEASLKKANKAAAMSSNVTSSARSIEKRRRRMLKTGTAPRRRDAAPPAAEAEGSG